MKKEKAELNAAIKAVVDRKLIHRKEVYVNDVHEYDYVKDDTDCDTTLHQLYHSENSDWNDNTKATLALEIVNTGSGIILQGLKTNSEIDYMKIEQLYILLRLMDEGTRFQISQPSIKISF